jgi:hypothetical protein
MSSHCLSKNDWWMWVRVKWTITPRLEEGGVCEKFWIYVHGANSHGRPRPPHYRGFTITLGHTKIGSTPGRGSAQRWDLHLRHSPQTGFHASGGIQTNNSSKRAAAHLSLRPRGHWELIGFEPLLWGFKFSFYNIFKNLGDIIGKY